MAKSKGKRKQNINFRETKSERSATKSYTNFRQQFVKQNEKLKGVKGK